MFGVCRRIAQDHRFQNFITGVIIFAGILVGAETYPAVIDALGGPLHVLDQIVLWIFVVEIAIKMAAEWPRPWRYFLDGWNVFDFAIVVAAFMPFAADYATVLRLLRLLRVLRLVRAVPKLQMLVGALLKSIPSMAYVSLLLMLLFYIYAVAGVFIWGGNDPVHFQDLQTSMLSLFRVATLEDWTDVMYINMFGCDQYGYGDMMDRCTAPASSPVTGALFFVTFVLFGTMIILNLFIGVILNGMDEAQRETAAQEAALAMATADGGAALMSAEVKALAEELKQMQERVHRLHGLALAEHSSTPTPGSE